MSTILREYWNNGDYLDIDVFDADYDIGCAWVMDRIDGPDDRLVEFMASQIEVVGSTPSVMVADISGFVRRHYPVLQAFTERTSTLVMPKKVCDRGIEIGIMTVNGLVSGHYGDADYESLLKAFGVTL